MSDAVFLKNFDDWGLVVLKVKVTVPVGMESDPLAGSIQQIRRWDGLLTHLIDRGQEVFQSDRSIRAGLDLCDSGTIHFPNKKNCIRNRSYPIACVHLVDGQIGALIVG